MNDANTKNIFEFAICEKIAGHHKHTKSYVSINQLNEDMKIAIESEMAEIIR